MSDHLTNLIRAQIRSDLYRDMVSVLAGAATNAVAKANDSAMTMDKLQATRRLIPPTPPRLTVTFSTFALKDSEERLFPPSKHRSRRILKKLIKRHGGVFRRVPAMYVINGEIIAHPSFRSQLEAQFKETNHVPMHSYNANPILRPTWL
ncbi:hypothetical protein ACRQ5Q_15305 [Bradyrhizobium sp. PMVTL-01]|uniref:hypothetical protein n=1 Tax=Bradyrhizobium sp. PMVTL-01 TaxID=3434999 RepID=UPI003F6FC3EF